MNPSIARLALALLLLSMLPPQLPAQQGTEVPADIARAIAAGQFGEAETALEKLADAETDAAKQRGYLFERERLLRIRKDYTVTSEEMLDLLRAHIPDVTEADMTRWRDEGALEGRTIDGEWFYFGSARSNLYWRSKEARARRTAAKGGASPDETYTKRQVAFAKRIAAAWDGTDPEFFAPRRFELSYTLTVNADEVPAGQTIRAWLPFPRESQNSRDMKLVSASPGEPHVADNDACLQRSVYLDAPAVAGEPTTFTLVTRVTVLPQTVRVDPAKVVPHDPDSELFREYTAERPPHLALNPEIRALAARIAPDETNSYLVAYAIWTWIQDNIRYAYAPEYSTVPNLATYCLDKGQGDCGQQAMLFIALCRARGIPARWQSGWALFPGEVGMHDWAWFHVEPYGWLPADLTEGRYTGDDPLVRDFGFAHLDGYRFVVNDDFGQELCPPKKHFRSEPWDFQRGEVEWEGGNLYFSQWRGSLKAEELGLEE